METINKLEIRKRMALKNAKDFDLGDLVVNCLGAIDVEAIVGSVENNEMEMAIVEAYNNEYPDQPYDYSECMNLWIINQASYEFIKNNTDLQAVELPQYDCYIYLQFNDFSSNIWSGSQQEKFSDTKLVDEELNKVRKSHLKLIALINSMEYEDFRLNQACNLIREVLRDNGGC